MKQRLPLVIALLALTVAVFAWMFYMTVYANRRTGPINNPPGKVRRRLP